MRSAEKMCRVILVILAALVLMAGYTVVRAAADDTAESTALHQELQLKEHISIKRVDLSDVESVGADAADGTEGSGTSGKGLQMLGKTETPLFNVDLSGNNGMSLIDPLLWAASAAALILILVNHAGAAKRIKVLKKELEALASEQGE